MDTIMFISLQLRLLNNHTAKGIFDSVREKADEQLAEHAKRHHPPNSRSPNVLLMTARKVNGVRSTSEM